jgi:hypothetical protein
MILDFNEDDSGLPYDMLASARDWTREVQPTSNPMVSLIRFQALTT